MKVVRDMFVSFVYELKDQHGQLLDNSEISGPINYIHGHQSLLPSMEASFEGRIQDEKFTFSISSDQAYGDYRPEAVFIVPLTSFKHPEYLELGLQFEWTMEDTQHDGGEKILVFVRDIGQGQVTLDANHPLAGKELFFDVHVTSVREPTAEELESIKKS